MVDYVPKRTRSPSVTLVVHSLDQNPIVRAAPLGWALERLGFEVEVVGCLPAGKTVYPPYATAFKYRTATRPLDLPRLTAGDIVYSFKPLVTTLLPAMIATRGGTTRPVLLDVEDDDLGVCGIGTVKRSLEALGRALSRPKSLAAPLTHAFRRRCVATTVSTSRLQEFYGGSIVLHGPDESVFRPPRVEAERTVARESFGLPASGTLILFAGFPQEHKGFQEILQATQMTGSHLVLAGPSDSAAFTRARALLGGRCTDLGFVKHDDMSTLLSAIDIVPITLRDVPFSEAQLPAKLLEAMAMERAVVVSDVGDLPKIVRPRGQGSARGWVVPAGDALSLASCFEEINQGGPSVRARCKRAAEYVSAEASVTANRDFFERLFLETPRLRSQLHRVQGA